MVGVVRQALRRRERVGQADLPVQRDDAAFSDRAHHRDALTVVLVNEHVTGLRNAADHD